MKGGQRDAQRVMCQDRLGNRFGWANHRTLGAEAFRELFPEALEELNVFCFFTRKLEQRPHPVIVSLQLLSRVVHDERQDELFHQSEDAKVSVAADLIENSLLVSR